MSGARGCRALSAAAAIVAVVLLALFVTRRWSTSEDDAVPVAGPEIVRDPGARPSRVREKPPEPPPAPAGSIRVAVTAMDGTPIPGARVELVRGPTAFAENPDFAPSAAAPPSVCATVAGADGAAILAGAPPGRWFVVAQAPGFGRHVLAGVTRDASDAPLDTSVALDRGHVFAGTVRDDDGAPAAGVAVVLEARRPTLIWRDDSACVWTRTAADGSFRFEGVEPGPHALWCAQRSGVLVDIEHVLVPSLDGLDVRRVRGAAIEGTVRDADTGAALPGTRLFAQEFIESKWSGGEGTTTLLDTGTADAFGRFALHTGRRACGLSRLVVDADGYVPAPIDAGRDGVPGDVADGQRFVFDVRLRRALTLTGTVLGPDGPLAELQVAIASDDVPGWPPREGEESTPTHRAWSNVTGADGRFRVERLRAGKVELAVVDAASRSYFNYDEVDLPAGGDVERDVRVELRRVRITRKVVDPEDRPIEGVDVSQDLGPFHPGARTGPDGVFSMEMVFARDPPSILAVRRDGYRATGDVYYFHEGAEGPIHLARVREITGTVTLADGTPVAGTRVLLGVGFQGVESSSSKWEGTRETFTAGDGTYRIPLMGGPDHWLRVPLTNRWSENESSDEEVENEQVDVKIGAPVRVAVRVVASADGKPIAGALLRNDDEVVVSRAGPDGRIAVEVPAGWAARLHVTADGWLSAPIGRGGKPDAGADSDADDGPPAAARPDVDAGADVPEAETIILRPALAIAGVVRLADGTPVQGLRVSVTPPGADPDVIPSRRLASSTDATGRFVIAGLDAGAHQVTVTDPVRYAHTSVHVSATSGGADLAFVVGPAVRLDVEVVGGDDDSLPDARVLAVADGAESAIDEGRTDGWGRLSLALAPDAPHTIRVDCDGYAPAERRDVRGGGGEPLRIVLARARR